MPFSELDTAAVARTLAQLAERSDDLVDAFFERREELELPPADEGPGLRLRHEEGFAVRLVRARRTWLSSRDGIAGKSFAEALRQVARALPALGYPEPAVAVAAPEPAGAGPDLRDFPAAVGRAMRAHHVAFPLRLTVRRHRRWVQVVGPRLVPAAERETFYSCTVESAAWRAGALLPALDAAAAEAVAGAAVERFRARHAAPPEPFTGVLVLGPEAVAVLLHEAAHALEADLLAQSGSPEAAVGLTMAAPFLDLLDDPAAAPAPGRRTTDDEGLPVCRRWLLRAGRVEQPLADALWAASSPALVPGAGRRAIRHLPPAPRSSHLELLAGKAAPGELLADAPGGLYAAAASRGTLDAQSGELSLQLPCARRIRRRGMLGEPVGPCWLRGPVAELLARAAAAGSEPRPAGAGWCAKGGQKLPVWATAPALRLEGVALSP